MSSAALQLATNSNSEDIHRILRYGRARMTNEIVVVCPSGCGAKRHNAGTVTGKGNFEAAVDDSTIGGAKQRAKARGMRSISVARW
jgi:hypothetical protein